MVLFACTPTRTSAPQPPDNKHTEQPTALQFAAPRGSRRRNLRTRWHLAAPVVRALLEFLLRARLLLVRWRGLVGRQGLGSWLGPLHGGVDGGVKLSSPIGIPRLCVYQNG